MVVFVVVIYGVAIEDCVTFLSLTNSLSVVDKNSYKIIVVDNSENKICKTIDVDHNVVYMANGENLGLAFSYNIATKYAKNINADALITLDQDSIVTCEYIRVVFSSLKNLVDDCVAMCPTIRSSGRIVSPFVFDRFGYPRYGGKSGCFFGINSFSVYSVKYLVAVGGFDEYYWLDALDFSIYAKIKQKNYAVSLLGVVVDHDLSLLSGRVSRWRMLNIAKYEACFLFEYCCFSHILTGLLRLIFRSIRIGINKFGFVYLMDIFVSMVIGSWVGMSRRINKASNRVWV